MSNAVPENQDSKHSRLRTQTAELLREYYSGNKLWGDDFNPEEIKEWYSLEENACFEIYDEGKKRMPNNDYMHWEFGYRWALKNRNSLGKVLGIGSGNGEEFRPVRKWIEHLYIVESAAGYFKNDDTTTYAKAQVDGTLMFEDEFFDTAVNIAVLHHIPNVTDVLKELYRVLKKGGVCLIKEPITTLGPWHVQRKQGLAPCERGFPRKWLDQAVEEIGFREIHRTYFEFPPLRHVRDRGGIDTYNSAFWTGLDQIFCRLSGWNYSYHRESFFKKLAPSYVFLVLQKPA